MALGIQEIRIPTSGVISVTAPSGNFAVTYSDNSVKGHVQKVSFNYATASGTGSVWLFVSGTGEQVAFRTGSQTQTVYPRLFPTNNTSSDNVGSPNTMVPYTVNAPLYAVGSSLATGATFFATVTYETP